jgi:hypothetical protein
MTDKQAGPQWPRVEVVLAFFSETADVTEMARVAKTEPDRLVPSFETGRGARVGRASAIFEINASGDVANAEHLVARVLRRVVDSEGGLVALSEECESVVLSICFYLCGSESSPSDYSFRSRELEALAALGADVRFGLYRDT